MSRVKTHRIWEEGLLPVPAWRILCRECRTRRPDAATRTRKERGPRSLHPDRDLFPASPGMVPRLSDRVRLFLGEGVSWVVADRGGLRIVVSRDQLLGAAMVSWLEELERRQGAARERIAELPVRLRS